MKKPFLISLFLLPHLLWSQIMEISRFDEILIHIQHAASKNMLVVLDIDNTLLQADQQLGSVAWGDHMISELKSKGMTEKEAEEVQSIFWRTVQPHIKIQAVDPQTASVIDEIQKQKIPVLCLTSRTPQEASCTHTQLASLGIFPSMLSVVKEGAQIPLQPKAEYHEGILFATPLNKKSVVLLKFFKQNCMRPECVLFVDDKSHHVQDVFASLQKEGIPCIGLRFNGADESVKKFEPLIAEIQWKAFPHPLSDEEARTILLSIFSN